MLTTTIVEMVGKMEVALNIPAVEREMMM